LNVSLLPKFSSLLIFYGAGELMEAGDLRIPNLESDLFFSLVLFRRSSNERNCMEKGRTSYGGMKLLEMGGENVKTCIWVLSLVIAWKGVGESEEGGLEGGTWRRKKKREAAQMACLYECRPTCPLWLEVNKKRQSSMTDNKSQPGRLWVLHLLHRSKAVIWRGWHRP